MLGGASRTGNLDWEKRQVQQCQSQLELKCLLYKAWYQEIPLLSQGQSSGRSMLGVEGRRKNVKSTYRDSNQNFLIRLTSTTLS